MKHLIALALLAALSTPTQAGSPCSAFAPYYHRIPAGEPGGGPGSILADLFLFPGSLVIATVALGGPRRDVVRPSTGERRRVASAACMPISLVGHYRATRPDRAEHWEID